MEYIKSQMNEKFFIMPFIYSFEISKVNFFPALTTPFVRIILSNLFIVLEVALEALLLTNPGTLSLAKGKTRSVTTFLPNIFNQHLRNPPN